MPTILLAVLFSLALFGGVLACLRIGWKIGQRRLRLAGEDGQAGLGALEGAVFGLMGLLIAFTFTGAATRFHERRDLVTQHVNAIGTAWLRLDLLDPSSRERARMGFRRYVDGLIELTQDAGNESAAKSTADRLAVIQGEIWATLIDGVRGDKPSPPPQVVLLPPTNEMFDLTTTRLMAARQHPPIAVFLLLGVLVLVSSLLAGFGMAKAGSQSPVHLFGFAAIMALSIYLILDIEYPRLGLVKIDSFDQPLIELRRSMEPSPGKP